MQAYIQAAEQLQEDLLDEYRRSHPNVPREKILESCPNGKLVLDNVQIVIKNSAKYKLFCQRVRGEKRSILEGDDLLYAYLTTSNDDSYNDSLESAKCCKKVSYFLFTSRYERFNLVERTKYNEALRKYENRLPELAIDLYNRKKALLDMMDKGKPTHREIQPQVVKYYGYLKDLLETQSHLYRIEHKLGDHFKSYMNEVFLPVFSSPGFRMDPAKLKALVQTLKAYEERGLEFEPLKEKLSSQHIFSLLEALDEQMDCLRAEIRTIGDVTTFIKDIVEYADPPEEIQQSKAASDEVSLLAAIRDKVTASFAEWLSS